jgi:WS/DGAT/MGAT family acyltransferase
MGVHTALHPRKLLETARSALQMIVKEELHAAPRTSLNEPIGTLRRFEVVRVPLAELKEIKLSLGGTVNDVALAVTSSGLRAQLQSRGEQLPEDGLRAMVPMNLRDASERLALGNRISSLFVELPVAANDPLERYRETVMRSRSLKSDGQQAAGTTAVIALAGLAPPVIHSTIAQALYATRLFNVTITNVPGPQQTLYAFGAPLREIYPLVPLAAKHSVVSFGVVADRDSVRDLDVLLRAMRGALGELLEAARAGGTGPAEESSPPAHRGRAAPAGARTAAGYAGS